MSLTVGSLFSGIGGIDIGFQQAGFDIAWAVEKDVPACRTYRYNFSGATLIEADIRDIDTASLDHVDVLAAGFPCQSFSVAGKQHGFQDTRGNLFYEVIRFANNLKPRVIFLENVPNLTDHNGGHTFNAIYNALAGEGYFVHYKVMRASGNVKKCAVGKHPKSEKLGSAGQAAVCACTHSRYFTGGSPSGLRV